MHYDFLNVIGLMTGTSMDGIDISLVQTNGQSLKRLNKNNRDHGHENANDTIRYHRLEIGFGIRTYY